MIPKRDIRTDSPALATHLLFPPAPSKTPCAPSPGAGLVGAVGGLPALCSGAGAGAHTAGRGGGVRRSESNSCPGTSTPNWLEIGHIFQLPLAPISHPTLGILSSIKTWPATRPGPDAGVPLTDHRFSPWPHTIVHHVVRTGPCDLYAALINHFSLFEHETCCL